MTDLQNYIRSYFGIETSQLEQIGSLFRQETISKGAFYAKAGRVCDQLSFIQNGLMRFYADANGKEVTQWIASGGYFVADLSSLVFRTPSRWSIQALTDVELYTVDRKNYERIGELVPGWHELEKLFIAKCFVMLENRIFSHLSLSAEERYDQLFQSNPALLNQVPLQYIASMLGMTPETFSRIRKKKIS
ncbi:MAG: Crp/Fnr family transcriptional regulator [Agriterribacter sp.]